MKKNILLLFCLGFFMIAKAQKTLPEIKAGTMLHSTAFVQGQEVPLLFTIKSITAPVILGWSVDGYGDGTFEISKKGFENGTEIYMAQPPTGPIKLGDNETYGLISQDAYKSLTDNKTFTYNKLKFTVKTSDENPMKIGGKEMDVSHVVSEDNKVELWILNNASLPLIVQTAGLPIDILVKEIK